MTSAFNASVRQKVKQRVAFNSRVKLRKPWQIFTSSSSSVISHSIVFCLFYEPEKSISFAPVKLAALFSKLSIYLHQRRCVWSQKSLVWRAFSSVAPRQRRNSQHYDWWNCWWLSTYPRSARAPVASCSIPGCQPPASSPWSPCGRNRPARSATAVLWRRNFYAAHCTTCSFHGRPVSLAPPIQCNRLTL